MTRAKGALRVVVVGAGVTGLSTALAAARLGARVLVLERDHAGAGSSGLSLGVFNRQTPRRQELELRIRSIAEFDRMEARGELPLERPGYVRLATSAAALEQLRETVAAQQRLGYRAATLLTPAELQALVPGMHCSDLAGGLFGPSDGTIDGHLLCGAFRTAAEDLGAELRVRCALESSDFGRDEIVLHTSSGPIACDRVINAAGAWAPAVARTLGVRCELAVQRHAICMGRIAGIPEHTLPIINEYMPGNREAGLVVRPEGPDRLLAMLHSQDLVDAEHPDPDRCSRAVGFDYVERVAERLAARLPGLADQLSLEAGWAGLYPISADGRLQIGAYAREPRIVVAAGTGGVGITIAPAVGRLAAEWAVLGHGVSVPFADELRPDRASLAPARTR